MALLKLVKTDGEEFWINTEKVRALRPWTYAGADDTEVVFSETHTITVKGSLDQVALLFTG